MPKKHSSHVIHEWEQRKGKGSFNTSFDDFTVQILPQAFLYNVSVLQDFSYSSAEYCMLPCHTREVCLEPTVSLGFFGVSLFEDTVTKPCCVDGLCSSKAETEKRNDQYEKWSPGCCLLRLPQWNLNVLLFYRNRCYITWLMNHLFLLALLLLRTASTRFCHLGLS